ncbi:MAG: hypothetical protein ACKO7Q_00565, partial [Actinomycetota bacterium]
LEEGSKSVRSLAVLCLALLVALTGGTASSWAAPTPEASTPTAACPETLLPLPNRARVVRDLAPGVTLRVWRVEQPAACASRRNVQAATPSSAITSRATPISRARRSAALSGRSTVLPSPCAIVRIRYR